jgi:hypothetical protein
MKAEIIKHAIENFPKGNFTVKYKWDKSSFGVGISFKSPENFIENVVNITDQFDIETEISGNDIQFINIYSDGNTIQYSDEFPGGHVTAASSTI